MKKWIKKREENNNEINNQKSKMKKEKLYDTTKFKGLIKKLQGLKIQEIDTVNKFNKNKNIKYLSSRKRVLFKVKLPNTKKHKLYILFFK